MSGRLKRALSLILAIVMLSAGSAFAATASVVSPSANGIITGDSILLSVKVSDPGSIRVGVYLEKDYDIIYNERGEEVETRYKDIEGFKSFVPEDLAKIAAGTLTDVSGAAIKFSTGTEIKTYKSIKYTEPVVYENTGEIGFYTKQLSDVRPGIYKIQVETLGTDTQTVTSLTTSYVLVKEKPLEQSTEIFGKTGALQFIQNLLQSLFK